MESVLPLGFVFLSLTSDKEPCFGSSVSNTVNSKFWSGLPFIELNAVTIELVDSVLTKLPSLFSVTVIFGCV